MTELDRINRQTNELRAETERLAKRKDGIYHTLAFAIAFVALAVALISLAK